MRPHFFAAAKPLPPQDKEKKLDKIASLEAEKVADLHALERMKEVVTDYEGTQKNIIDKWDMAIALEKNPAPV